jgi:tRNA (guanine-N7-)-methyltransferase
MRNPKYKDDVLAKCNFYIDENLFTNNNEIRMEIGMGKGDFLLNMALKYPNINFIGVEKYSSVAAVAINKIMDYDLDNLKLFIGDAINLPEYLFHKISVIYLNFSDPWPKAKHDKRRLTHENYLKYYDNLFIEKNRIIMKTDNDELFAFSEESFLNHGYRIIKKSYDLHSENIDNIETEYEKKFSTKGTSIKYIEVEK